MQRELILTTEPIDETRLHARRQLSDEMGALISFLGVVRGREGDTPIHAIAYEAFEQMARHQFALIFDAVENRWPIETVRLVHRIGFVKVGEPSLWVEVAAPHREEAFAACQFIIEQMKLTVPIWKKPLPAPVE